MTNLRASQANPLSSQYLSGLVRQTSTSSSSLAAGGPKDKKKGERQPTDANRPLTQEEQTQKAKKALRTTKSDKVIPNSDVFIISLSHGHRGVAKDIMILHHHLPSISLVVLALLVFHVCQVFALISSISPLHGVVYANAPYSIKRQSGARSRCILAYHNSTESVEDQLHQVHKASLSRFYREADQQTEIPNVCILTIHGNDYNMTNWAKAHPGNLIVNIF